MTTAFGHEGPYGYTPEYGAPQRMSIRGVNPAYLGSSNNWQRTDPEYAAAPGFDTYAPTAAYRYSPMGATFDPTAPPGTGFTTDGTTGGGGGGGGGFGNFLNALSTANSLSNLVTGKGLLDHAGIKNPLSDLFGGGDGLNLQALNPASDVPLTALFGDAGRNLGLASSAFPNALPGGVGGSVGIGPSGYLSPDALAGISNPVSAPVTVAPTPTVPAGGFELFQKGSGGQVYPMDFVPSYGSDAFPYTVQGTAPLEPVYGGYELGPLPQPVSPGAIDAGKSVAEAITGAETGTPTAGPYGANPAYSEAALNTLVPGYNTTLGAASAAAGMSPALTSAYMTGAIPEFAGLGFGTSAPGAGFLGAGALGPLALAGGLFMAMKGMKKDDPTINAKIMAEMGRQAEAAMGGDEGALASIKARLFGDAQSSGEAIGHMTELVSSGRQEGPGWANYVPYGAPNQDPTALVGWRPDIAKFYRDIIYPEHGKIHDLRGDMVGRRNADDPIQFNPFIDSISSKIRTAAESGEDGPVDIWGASKASGYHPEDVALFTRAYGRPPAGYVDWRNDPNSPWYVDPTQMGGI